MWKALPALPVLLISYLPGLAALAVGLTAALLGAPLGGPWLWASALAVCVLLIGPALVLVRRDRGGLRRDRDELARRLTETELHRKEFVAELLVNLARRSQGMVYRQLEILGRLQAAERDQDTLAELFALDHLATRVRRTAENLLVLAGAQAPRTAVVSAPLREVVRSGITETEDLERVLFIVEEQQRVAGHAAADLAHLLSELVENAVRFSPPDSVVTVRSSRSDQSGRGRLLTVEDWGVGIPPDATAAANTLMAEPREVDLSVSQRLGLHVVARLAQRHGIQVTLGAGPSGGTVCTLNLPAALFELGAGPDPERDGVTTAIPLGPTDTDVTATQRIPTIPRVATRSPSGPNPTGDELFGAGSTARGPGTTGSGATPTGSSRSGSPAADRGPVAKTGPARTGSGPTTARQPATESRATGKVEPGPAPADAGRAEPAAGSRPTASATTSDDVRTVTSKLPEGTPPSPPATAGDEPATDRRPDSAAPPASAEPGRNQAAAARPEPSGPGSAPSSDRYSNGRDRAAAAGPSVFIPGSTPDDSPNPPPAGSGSDSEATTTIRVPTARAARPDVFDPAAVPRQAGPPAPVDDVGRPDVLPHRAPRRRVSAGPPTGPFGSTGRWEGWWESQEGPPSPVSATAPASTGPWPVVSVPGDNALPTRPRPPAAAPPGPARADARRPAAAPVAWVDPTPAGHSRPGGPGLFDVPSPTEPPAVESVGESAGESVGESRAGLHRRVPQANLAPELRDPALDEPAEPPAYASGSAAALSRYQASREAARIAVSEEGPAAQGRSGAPAGPVASREDARSASVRYESGRSGESIPQTDTDRPQPAAPPGDRHDGEGDRRSTAPDAAHRPGPADAPDPVDPPAGSGSAEPGSAEPGSTAPGGDGAWSGDNRAMHPDPGDRTAPDAEPGGDR